MEENLIKFLLDNLVPDPKSLEVKIENPSSDSIVIKILAPKDQISLIIGKGGKIINSLRKVVGILSASNNRISRIEVLEKPTATILQNA